MDKVDPTPPGRDFARPMQVVVNARAVQKLAERGWLDRLATEPGAEILLTEAPDDARRFARRALADGCRTLLVAGGDGTVNQVVDGLGGDALQLVIGIIPIGTGNDLAATLGIPEEPAKAVETLRGADAVDVDAIELSWADGRRVAVNACTAGFSALVDDNLDADVKELLGGLAYLLSAGRTLPALEPHRVRLTIDGVEEPGDELYNVIVANGRTIGGGVRVAPSARLDDGLLDLLLVPALPLAQLALVVPRIALGEHLDDERVVARQVRRVELDADPPMRLTADGEVVGTTPAKIRVLPRAVRVLASRGWSGE